MRFSSFQSIIQFAIKREKEAAHSYGEMVKTAKNAGLKKLLQGLQKDETNHRTLLLNLTKEKIESADIKDVTDLKISNYLVEEPLSEDMNFQDLLIFAAKKEDKAMELYSDLRKKSKKKEQKMLFGFLEMQEKSHKLKLETEYEKHVLSED